MKTFIIISWRNLWRNKRRSFVVIGSVAIGILGMMLSMAFMNSLTMQMIDNTINTSMGHVAVHKKGFRDTLKLKDSFALTKNELSVLEEMKKNKKLLAYAPRVQVSGVIYSGGSVVNTNIMGIDPVREKALSKIYDYTLKTNGSSFLDRPDMDVVLISETTAKKFDLQVGDRVAVALQDKNKKLKREALTIQGIFKTPIDTFDKYTIFVGIKKLQSMAALDDDITEVNILTTDKKRVDTVKSDVAAQLKRKDLVALSWKDRAPQLVRAVKLFDSTMYVFFAIIFITVVFSIANTLVMAIMERFHEIGVMKSIGTRPSQVFFMIIFEAINLSVVGLAVGLAASMLFIGYWALFGLDLSFYMEGMRAFGTGSILYPFLRPKDFGMSIMIILVITTIGALYPAIKAARIKPLEALTYV